MNRTRTFIAVPLSEEIRRNLAGLRREFGRELPGVKWTETQNLHVTMVFLGEVENRETIQVCRLAEAAVKSSGLSAFNMTVQGLGCFPNSRRPRVLWCGIGEGSAELKQLHQALELHLTDLGYREETRAFAPHITLGRTKSDGPLNELSELIRQHADWQAGQQSVDELHVLGSKLGPGGPKYTIIGRVRIAVSN